MRGDLTAERRWRLTHRAAPGVAVIALVALLVGIAAGGGASKAESVGNDFGAAWARGDYAAMHRLLAADDRRRLSRAELAAVYGQATATATATAIAVAEAEEQDGAVRLPVNVDTRIFGKVSGRVELTVTDGAVDWARHMVFPGLRPGEELGREIEVPERAAILAADGQPLAEGPADARSSPIPEVASSIAGSLAPVEDEAERERLYARGFPPDTPVGASGLERVFEREVAGRPGGRLLAGRRVLARSSPAPAKPARSTIVPSIQEAASVALAGRLGGVAALDPATGEIVGLAGIAFSAPQPPGSTFKIVTTTAALEARKVKLSDEFPVETAATIDGVELANASGEYCGGGFAETFAHSCNSVFAPLGVEVGAEKLVETAERFGWNEAPGIPGAVASEIPPASEIVSPLEVGSTAIGQFRTLATTLQMASVAQTIANRGVRLPPTLSPRGRGAGAGERVTSPKIAATIGRMMVDVVEYGTGTLAHVDGVEVAGKTGTAELGDTRGDPEAVAREGDPTNTDAWFTAYAPASKPRIAVCVMLVRNGAGGSTAAPAAQGVLVAGLEATS